MQTVEDEDEEKDEEDNLDAEGMEQDNENDMKVLIILSIRVWLGLKQISKLYFIWFDLVAFNICFYCIVRSGKIHLNIYSNKTTNLLHEEYTLILTPKQELLTQVFFLKLMTYKLYFFYNK